MEQLEAERTESRGKNERIALLEAESTSQALRDSAGVKTLAAFSLRIINVGQMGWDGLRQQEKKTSHTTGPISLSDEEVERIVEGVDHDPVALREDLLAMFSDDRKPNANLLKGRRSRDAHNAAALDLAPSLALHRQGACRP